MTQVPYVETPPDKIDISNATTTNTVAPSAVSLKSFFWLR